MIVQVKRGHSLALTCITIDRQPVVDCVAVVSTFPMVAGHPSRYAVDAFGNPYSRAPMWIGHASRSGRICIGGIPAGSWYVRLHHAVSYPENITTPAWDVDRALVVPCKEQILVFKELCAVVAAIPSEDKTIVSHRFTYTADDMVISGPVMGQSVVTATTLRDRFPGSITLCRVPKRPDIPSHVTVTAVASDGSPWRLVWGLEPVSSIRGPAFLEPDPIAGLRAVTVRATRQGREIKGLDLVAFEKGRRSAVTRFESGRPQLLPAGRIYELTTGREYPFLTENIECHRVQVPEGEGPLDVPIELSRGVREVSVDVRFPHGEPDSPFQLTYSIAGIGLEAAVLWNPGQPSKLRFWFPEGRLSLKATATGYSAFEHAIAVEAGDEILTIPVVLQYK